MNRDPSYVGRFAPSPSGRLHLGSLVTAFASFFQARANHGKYLIRIEDLDLPRCPFRNTPVMMQELAILGLFSDEPVIYQSKDQEFYESEIARLLHQGKAYYCNCTRAKLKERPCHCVNEHVKPVHTTLDETAHILGPQLFVRELGNTEHLSIRSDLTNLLPHYPSFEDGNLGTTTQESLEYPLAHSLVLMRADRIVSYNLAVVLDDLRQGITEVVRGADLLDATFLQLALYEILGETPPKFFHIPLITTEDGHKLSKQNFAPAMIDEFTPAKAVVKASALLNLIDEESFLSKDEEKILSALKEKHLNNVSDPSALHVDLLDASISHEELTKNYLELIESEDSLLTLMDKALDKAQAELTADYKEHHGINDLAARPKTSTSDHPYLSKTAIFNWALLSLKEEGVKDYFDNVNGFSTAKASAKAQNTIDNAEESDSQDSTANHLGPKLLLNSIESAMDANDPFPSDTADTTNSANCAAYTELETAFEESKSSASFESLGLLFAIESDEDHEQANKAYKLKQQRSEAGADNGAASANGAAGASGCNSCCADDGDKARASASLKVKGKTEIKNREESYNDYQNLVCDTAYMKSGKLALTYLTMEEYERALDFAKLHHEALARFLNSLSALMTVQNLPKKSIKVL